MQSTSPPPPPPYASKHTIIAAPPTISNLSSLASPPSTSSKLPSFDPSGHRVSTALNITFSPPASTDANRFFNRRSIPNDLRSQPVASAKSSPAGIAASAVGAPLSTEWKSDTLHHHPVVLRRSSSGAAASLHSSSCPTLGVCPKCDSRITNVATACQALGCFYHDECFICCCCQRTLHGKTFYKDQDKIYCEEDYLYCGFQRMAKNCAVCGHIIAQTILQAMGKSYHPGCFRCTICNKCMDEEPFTVDRNGRIFCLYDFYLATAPTCAACANPILPDPSTNEVLRVVAMNKEFHIECYRCEDCDLLLSNDDSSRCYPYVETGEDGLPGRIHLLCLKCHLTRIGATPAPGQNLDALIFQPGRRGSNGSSSFASSCDLRVPGSASPVRIYSPTPTSHSNKPTFTPAGGGGRSSPFSVERRPVSKPWLSSSRPGYYNNECDGR